MTRSAKGSDFEREICKRLSRWWTDDERDDVFWRSSQSGGRATQRAKQGLQTFGSYGDIAATDPIGQPLMTLFTIELKRGYSYAGVGDIFDRPDSAAQHPWEAFVEQSVLAAEAAGSTWWMLICKRDRKQPMVFIPYSAYSRLQKLTQLNRCWPCFLLSFQMKWKAGESALVPLQVYGTRLESFLGCVKKDHILHLHEQVSL